MPKFLPGYLVKKGNKIFFFLTNLRFFRNTLRSAVKAVSPKGAETEQGAKLGNRLGKGNMHLSFSTSP